MGTDGMDTATDYGNVVPGSIASTTVGIMVLGTMRGAMNPLFYELGVELTFPLPELTSSGFLSLVRGLCGAALLLFISCNTWTGVAHKLVCRQTTFGPFCFCSCCPSSVCTSSTSCSWGALPPQPL